MEQLTHRRGGRVTPVPEWLLLRVAEQLRVLGHAARMRIIERLAEEARTPQDLATEFGLSQQTVSKHLQVLYSVGLLSRRREGSRVLYALADDGVVDMVDRMVRRIALQLVELSRAAGGQMSDDVDDDEDQVRRVVGAGR